jgi:hypothetical protein
MEAFQRIAFSLVLATLLLKNREQSPEFEPAFCISVQRHREISEGRMAFVDSHLSA